MSIPAISTMRKLMATSSMSRLNQKIITIVSFLNDYEQQIFSSKRHPLTTEKFLTVKEKLRRINAIKRRAGENIYFHKINAKLKLFR